MKTLVFLNQKGGAGKTTLAIHVAAELEARGDRVVVYDLDPQSTASSWGHKRSRPPIVRPDHAARLAVSLQTAEREGVDWAIVDTAPSQDQSALTAAKLADQIVLPVRPAAFDLEAVANTLQLCQIAQRPSLVVINAAPIRSKVIDDAIEHVRRLGGIVAPVVIKHRVAFQHAVVDGRTAGEFEPDGAAAGEIAALVKVLASSPEQPVPKNPRRQEFLKTRGRRHG